MKHNDNLQKMDSSPGENEVNWLNGERTNEEEEKNEKQEQKQVLQAATATRLVGNNWENKKRKNGVVTNFLGAQNNRDIFSCSKISGDNEIEKSFWVINCSTTSWLSGNAYYLRFPDIYKPVKPKYFSSSMKNPVPCIEYTFFCILSYKFHVFKRKLPLGRRRLRIWPYKASSHYARQAITFLDNKGIKFVPKGLNPNEVLQFWPVRILLREPGFMDVYYRNLLAKDTEALKQGIIIILRRFQPNCWSHCRSC